MALGRINLTQEVSKIFKMNTQKQGRRFVDSGKSTANRRLSRRERKLALLQDVDKLKKKLSHEESVHRALERAFTRPLGSLPRLPPYLPPHTLALLAEVAVLEEEVVRLEEQVVNFRQGLYEESFSVSSSKRIKENPIISSSDTSTSQSVHESSPTMPMPIPLPIVSPRLAPSPGVSRNRSTWITNERQASRRTLSFDDTRNKENYSHLNMTRNNKQSHKPIEDAMAQSSTEKDLEMKIECTLVEQGSAREDFLVIPEETASSSPNKISEDILKCLSSILLRMSRNTQSNTFSSVIRLPSQENREQVATRDPYGICKEYGQRDIGPYKNLRVIEANSIDSNRKTNSLFLLQRLKILLGKLASVEIQGLTHLQKLAFWINVYNSCMMNAFLEHGIPNSPQKIIMLMQKAIINVGGESLNAMTIEHFILRLPHHLKSTQKIPGEHEVRRKQTHLGLEWSHLLSPVEAGLPLLLILPMKVRVYTPSQVENELEVAKKDYLKAAVGISSSNKPLDALCGEQSRSRNKELDRAVSLPLAEESRKPNGYRRPGDSDEDLARALQESLNTSSCPPYASQNFSRGYRLCGGCKHEIGSGNYLGCMGAFWHPECFCCHACGYPITEHEFSLSGRNPYHKSCFKEIYHPKCEVCHQFYGRLFLRLGHGAKRPEDLNPTIYARMKLTIPTNGAGLIEYRSHPFWSQKYCPSHEHDRTARCCSCEWLESWHSRYVSLGDGRSLCFECMESAIMDTGDCQSLYHAIRDYYEGMNMKLDQQIPMLLVERQALNEAIEGEKHGYLSRSDPWCHVFHRN